MVFIMEIYVDGNCRGNGTDWAVGAAAAVFKQRYGRDKIWTRVLPDDPPPTNQRAEITAIIVALQQAIAKYNNLDTNPYLDVTIYSDSRYAVGCMTQWIYKWCQNGWTNSAGYAVANQDLIKRASMLDDKVKDLGSVEYKWIPRAENQDADDYCNQALDAAEGF